MTPGQIYKVRKGDTLSGIAKTSGHRKWEIIWSDPANRALVSKRRKPELTEDKLNDKARAAAAEHKDSSNDIVALVGTGMDWWKKVQKPSFRASAYLNWKDGASPAAALNKARLNHVRSEIEERTAAFRKQDAASTTSLKRKRDTFAGHLQETRILSKTMAAQP